MHQQLLRRHFEVLAPRGLLFPSDYQSMGFGLPAAIGAKLAVPERPVVAVLGDGGFAISGLELLTAVHANLSLTVIVFNDGQLGRIRLEQLAARQDQQRRTLEPPISKPSHWPSVRAMHSPKTMQSRCCANASSSAG